ncbi:MAG: hypothetical protein Q7S16_03760, partial [bacterium]|nr:hypothetical protein [bacterium]
MKRLFSSLLFLTAILVTGTVFAASSTNYTIPIDAIGGGGAKSTSTNYQLFDAIGETQGNKASSTNFLIRDGVPAAIQKIVVSGGPVVTPPSSPTSFTTQATSSVVTLTWIEAASTSNFTVEILRDRNPAPGIVSGNPLGVIAKGVQQYVDTTVSPSTAYIYQLRLVDEAEQTVLSSPLTVSTSANTPAVIPLPGIVTLQTPQTGTVLTTKKPLFAWQALSEVLSYQLEIDTAAGNFASPIRTFTIDAPASSYQLKSAEALADGAYQWRVRASNQSGIGSAPLTPFTFTIDTTPPSAPTLLSPSASASVNVRNPEFRWSGDTDVAEYDVQVFVTGITPPATLLTVLASPWTVADSLANGAYTWRVRARDAVGNTSAWSTRTLTIAVSSVVVDDQPLTGEILPPIIPPVQPALAPLAFSLTGPGAIITETKPTFTWSASVNATTYTLEILGDGTAFTKTVANIVTTSYTPAAPLPQGKYLWKVTASNGKGAFIVADPRSLIIDATPPPAPTLSQPSPDAQTALPVALVWTSVQDNLTSVTYTVQVDDGDFSSPAFVTAGTSDVNAASTTTFEINVRNFLNTQYLITNGLTPGITYRWRVWAKDAAGNMSTAPSAVRSFIIPVPAVAPSAFTLAESSEVTIDTTPTFQWTKSDGATAYTLFIQGNGANNTMTRAYPGSTEISFTKLSYTIADPLPLGTYTWYVRATNSAGIYSASSRLLTIATATITEEAQPEDLKIEPLLTLPLTEETAPATPIEEKIAEGVSTPIHSGTIEEAPTITVTLTSSATLATDRPLISGTFSARSTIAQVLI